MSDSDLVAVGRIALSVSLIALVSCSTAETAPQMAARLDTVAMVSLGNTEDAPLFQVSDAFLSGDTIFVAEASSGKVRLYSRNGKQLLSFGGIGKGPGEFTRLGWIQMVRDSLYAYDFIAARISVFDRSGQFVRSITLRRDHYRSVFAVGVFADGSFLIRAVPLSPAPELGVSRPVALLFRYDRDGRKVDSLGVYQGTETYRAPWGRRGGVQVSRVFGRRSAVELLGNGYLLVENNGWDISCFDISGKLVRRMTPLVKPSADQVSASDIRIARARFVKGQDPQLNMGAVFDEMPIPKSHPPYGWEGEHRLRVMTVTSIGDVWVLSFGGVRTQRPAWTVFDNIGRQRMTVSAPYELDVLDADVRSAIVLRWDEDDAEIVELRRIIRTAR